MNELISNPIARSIENSMSKEVLDTTFHTTFDETLIPIIRATSESTQRITSLAIDELLHDL